jgi:hypothetical protein
VAASNAGRWSGEANGLRVKHLQPRPQPGLLALDAWPSRCSPHPHVRKGVSRALTPCVQLTDISPTALQSHSHGRAHLLYQGTLLISVSGRGRRAVVTLWAPASPCVHPVEALTGSFDAPRLIVLCTCCHQTWNEHNVPGDVVDRLYELLAAGAFRPVDMENGPRPGRIDAA